ncbi:MAG TPA: trypsin-like peptidase domain-containing protein [Planctomycetota bacterium]|nr:trypsin-like peptidase domain-containing protein [Planctomycetota bacterium]
MPHPRPFLLAFLVLAAPAMEPDQRAAARAELAQVSQAAQTLSRAFELIHEIVGPSVVSIHTSRNEEVLMRQGHRLFVATREVDAGEGSGFVFASDGETSWIMTNSHVVLQTEDTRPAKFDRVTVLLNDNREVAAEYVGYDLATDLAVLKVPVPNLPAITWADSDAARVGDWVLALGYPLGVGYSATAGIVSATDRSTGIYQGVGGFESFIQTDAAINRGNSGGPLVTVEGAVTGVNANIISPNGASVGLGFAIPSNLARRVAEDLVAHGHVNRPQIGVALEELTPDEALTLGLPQRQTVRVAEVVPGTPADAGGVRRGDVILEVNGGRILSMQQFRARVASLRLEAPIDLLLWRDGAEVPVRLTPVSQEAIAEAVRKAAEGRGVTLRNFGMTLAVDDKPGLVVTAVAPGEAAALVGLSEGDRLLLERDLGELDDLDDAKAMAGQRELVLQVVQKGRSVWLRLRR